MDATEFRPTDEALSYLLSQAGEALLDQLAAEGVKEADLLSLTTRLRRAYPSDVVAAALDLSLLRRRARAKFSRADGMFFTRDALEQASAEMVSRYRAERYADRRRVVDLCCGIGGDTLGLAAHADVLAVDTDPIRLRMLEANARTYEITGRVVTARADVERYALSEGVCLWADPSRRVGGRRVFALAAYRPPLSALLFLADRAPGAGIKLSPGVDYGELESLLGERDCEVEIISVRGEAREAVLWSGSLVSAARRATLLPGRHTITDRSFCGPVTVAPVGSYLHEPDPAVIRAHLVEHVAGQLELFKIDAQIAYLSSDVPVESPFVTSYRVEEAMPFHLRRINRRLQESEVGELVIKKRGLPIDPERFRRRLTYGGGHGRLVLVLTRVEDRPTALFCRPAS